MRRAVALFVLVAAASACTGQLGGTPLSKPGQGGAGNGTVTGAGNDEGGFDGMSSGGECTDCVNQSVGVGTGQPFDPENKPSDNVGLDDDGALVLDPANSSIPGIIWIANTSFNTVTKVDTTTYQVLGRYATGSVDPSRTSVNSSGDVFVGNRKGNVLTKISVAGKDCPDTNNDGKITTSQGMNDVLAYGQDDCVLWSVPVPASPRVRGVAAQDVLVADPIPDDPDNVKVVHYVWVGGTNHRTAYKFDGDTGALLIQTSAPTGIYGLALDGSGQLWMSGNTDGNVIGRIDTTLCHDQPSCDAAETCLLDCHTGACVCDPGCKVGCDNAIKERIVLPTNVYGITVDFKQRVWTGGGAVQRYNPKAPLAQRYAAANTGFVHGIAADANGWIWGAGGGHIVRVDAEQLGFVKIGMGAKGMAIDKDGKVWGIEHGPNANVVIPGQGGLDDYTTNPAAVTGLGQCYTYSDMTGLQLALASNKPGYYRERYEGCSNGDTEWYTLDWDVEVSGNTSVTFKGRSGSTVAELEAAEWIVLGKIPADVPPVDLTKIFKSKNAPLGKLLEVEVWLKGEVKGDVLVSPKVKSFGVTYHCPPIAT
jgi:sugar lactone lactonase YvrE